METDETGRALGSSSSSSGKTFHDHDASDVVGGSGRAVRSSHQYAAAADEGSAGQRQTAKCAVDGSRTWHNGIVMRSGCNGSSSSPWTIFGAKDEEYIYRTPDGTDAVIPVTEL